MSTVEAILGNKIAPELLDYYLEEPDKTRRTTEPEDPNRPNNLWKPMPGDHGAHGVFDSRANEKSWELRASLNRLWLGIGFSLSEPRRHCWLHQNPLAGN